ncbi:17120_t:CDS:2, partial [Gigaspora margarita]
MSSGSQGVSPGVISSGSQNVSPGVLSSKKEKDISPGNMSFWSNNAVQHAVDIYSKQHDYVSIKLHKDLDAVDKTIIRHLEDISIHHDGASNKTNCPWMVHLYLRKRVNSITITNKIENYTVVGQLSASQQYDLLSKEFPDQHIKKKICIMLSVSLEGKNELIQMALSLFIGINNNFKSRVLAQALTKYEMQVDYEWILHYALESTNNLSPTVLFADGDPAMSAAVHIAYPYTHLLCIYHFGENIKKKAKSKLHGNMVTDFISDFYHMRNSSSKEIL